MFLKSLEMQGFKSFPDKTVLKLEKGITGVVGPNGSGKSNISDAVRWVLGEQSSKSLRGSKMEDVVFSGNAGGRKAHGFAEVTLRLDNTDRSLNYDDDEVAVTRRYYRSGESEYILNGEGVRLRDINELFMDTGLGRDGYSMVSQGRIADLVSSKSAQRREMLEEASGISHYRYRRADANRKLDQAEENLIRLRDILSELESRVGPLKTQSEKAKKFLELAGEKKDLEIGLWLHTIEKSRKLLKEQEEKLVVATAQYEDAEKELNSIEEELEALTAKSQGIAVSVDFIHRSNEALEEQVARLDSDAAVEENSIEHNNETIERLTRDIDALTSSKEDVASRINEEEASILEIEKQIENKKKELQQTKEKLYAIQSENETFADEILLLTEKIESFSRQLADARVRKSTADSSIEEISSRLVSVDETIESRKPLLENSFKEREEKQKELDSLAQKCDEAKNSIEGYSLKVQTRREKAEELKKEIDMREIELHKKSSRAKMLDDLEKNMDGYSGSVKTVMKEMRHGVLKGIHAPLSQLISVSDEYAAAIETALGASIQHIVTDNENDAKKAINYLKENRQGRATFLPISAIKSKPFPEKDLDDEFGFIDMADKLVSYDKKYEEIFKYELGHIAVVEDMDCAIAIAKRRGYKFKIVTLDGQLINAGGSMTGGSRTQNAGMLSRAGEIEKLNNEVKELTKKLEEQKEKFKTLSEDLVLSEANLSASQADLLTAQEDKIRAESALKLILGQIETLENGLKDLEDEKKNSETRIEIFTTASKESETKINALTAEIEALQADVLSRNSQREELVSSREEINLLENEINMQMLAGEKDIEAKKQSIMQLKSSIDDSEGKAEILKAEIEEIKEKNINIAENVVHIREESAKIRQKHEEAKNEIKMLNAQRNECEELSAQLRLKQKTVTDSREKINGELIRLDERKTSMQREYEDTINKLFDEYQLTRDEAENLGIVIENIGEAQKKLSEIKAKIRALGSVNTAAIEEYKEVSERYEFMKGQIEDIEKSRNELLKLISELTGKMSEQFRAQFARINSYFGETFAELFGGGKAELILEDPLNVLECPIEIKVQPPGKNVRNIDLLSGGEKGLSAIALLFAILKVTPAPFCIFDEVEAALDDVNVTRYAEYVRRMTKNTQFILITHRRGTMEEADVLYGVTMQEEGVSKMLELKTAEMAKKLGLA
ncbi:MAG: chromosome segregation protein SMC [Ruminococcaceae bacterium]|nr:chromosome segregation protein SMC [Oscillospiraceae bacterium]